MCKKKGENMKKLKLILTFGFVLLASLMLIACTNPETEIDEAAVVAKAKGMLTVPSNASENFTLPTSVVVDEEHTVTVSWTSNNAAIAINGGNATVTRPDAGLSDVTVTLTATLTFGDAQGTKNFDVVVPVTPIDYQAVVNAASNSFEFTRETAIANFPLTVTFVFTHSNQNHNITVSWESDDDAIVINGSNATVNRPGALEEEVDVTLTATFSVGGKTAQKTYTVTVLPLEPEAPKVKGLIYHWMPGAIGADVTAEVELNGAPMESFVVYFGEDELEADIDYELVDGVFTLFGTTLDVIVDGLGDLTITFESDFGSTDFDFKVVNNPVGTSIPTKTVTGYNVSTVPSYTPTAPIAGAPDLLITEVGGDSGLYNFIEIFNNTDAPYNLKGHRVVYGDLTKQGTVKAELFQEPLGMAGGIYIYQDYIIPALGKAYLWIVTGNPWTVEATASDPNQGRQIIEAVDAANYVFGPNEENLSLAKFRNRWQLAESALVFPIRPQYMLHNNTSAYNAEYGLGQPVAKGAASTWTDINTSTANRGIQIQKIDQETYFEVADFADTTGPVGSVYFRYEWFVTNKEEVVYVNGVIDRSKIEAYGTPGSANYRESINGLGIRKLYYNADKEFLGYASTITKQIDVYNANNANYLAMYEATVTPIVTALVYPDLVLAEDGETVVAAKWGPYLTMEYTLPAEGSILMRFIPRTAEPGYTAFYDADALKTVKLAGIANPVPALFPTVEVVVPVSPLYPTDYLSSGWNTIGRLAEWNFVPQPAS